LRANRRASWWRHVDSRLDAMATAARRGLGRRGGGAERAGGVSGDGARRWRGATAGGTARSDGAGRRRGTRVPGGGAGEADLQRGGGLENARRRNRPAAAKFCGGGSGGNGGRGRGGKISARWAFARVRRDGARGSRRLTFGAPDRANARAPQKNFSAVEDTVPAGGLISSPRTVYWRFFNARLI
jgi:hypothetical protein